jgi:hypothetical protein
MEHDIHISFRANPLIVVSNPITSLYIWDKFVFVGLQNGLLQIFKIKQKVEETSVQYSSVIKHELQISNKPVDKISLLSWQNPHMTTPMNSLLVLSDSTLSFYNVAADITSIEQHPTTIKEVNTYCTTDEFSSSSSLCVSSKKNLLLYSLSDQIECYKRYSLPEMPRSIMWFKNVICIGFNYEYSMMDALTGDVADILRIRNTFPYMKILPDDRIMLNDNKQCALFNGKKLEKNIKLTFPTTFIGFCFPFIYTMNRNLVEIQNIMDPVYNEIIRAPNEASLLYMADNGRYCIISNANDVYIIQPSSLNFQSANAVLRRTVFKANNDRKAVVRYLHLVLSQKGNPFAELFKERIEIVLKELRELPQTKDSFERMKRIILITLRHIFRFVISFFHEFNTTRELLYMAIQTYFFSKIFEPLFEHTKMMTKESDDRYNERLVELKKRSITPNDLNVDRKYWLNDESFEKPKEEEKNRSRSNSIHADRLSPLLNDEGLDLALSYTSFSEADFASLEASAEISSSLDPNDLSRSRLLASSGSFRSSPMHSRNASNSQLDEGALKSELSYLKAIKILRRLPGMRSPRGKMEILLKTLQETIQCIKDFWKNKEENIAVGADDLVPIFCYVVAKAAVKNIYAEMQVISEFASENMLRGQYGYCFATLQIVIEIIQNDENFSK